LFELDQVFGQIEQRRFGVGVEEIEIDVLPGVAHVLEAAALSEGHEFGEIERLVLGFEIFVEEVVIGSSRRRLMSRRRASAEGESVGRPVLSRNSRNWRDWATRSVGAGKRLAW